MQRILRSTRYPQHRPTEALNETDGGFIRAIATFRAPCSLGHYWGQAGTIHEPERNTARHWCSRISDAER